MNALPGASKEVFEHLFGPLPPRAGVPSPSMRIAYAQARITTFFARTAVSD